MLSFVCAKALSVAIMYGVMPVKAQFKKKKKSLRNSSALARPVKPVSLDAVIAHTHPCFWQHFVLE